MFFTKLGDSSAIAFSKFLFHFLSFPSGIPTSQMLAICTQDRSPKNKTHPLTASPFIWVLTLAASFCFCSCSVPSVSSLLPSIYSFCLQRVSLIEGHLPSYYQKWTLFGMFRGGHLITLIHSPSLPSGLPGSSSSWCENRTSLFSEKFKSWQWACRKGFLLLFLHKYGIINIMKIAQWWIHPF